MKKIDEVVNSKKCTGCSACLNICPEKAILMKQSKEGFWIPIVDEKKCTKCNLCNNICPILNENSKTEQKNIPTVYAGYAKDKKIKKNSSSGGVFYLLAEFVIEKHGVVCGASFDKNNKLKQMIVSKKIDLPKLMGSKYLQSETGNCFIEIKKILDKKKLVLFVGVSCQIAGLKKFLQKKYDNLILVDIVCHGTPSPIVFEKYIKEIETLNNKKVTKINFRDKSTGWKTYSFLLKNDTKTLYKELFNKNVFFQGFLKNLYLNQVCTNCSFVDFPRDSDITIGDYWGINNYKNIKDDNSGISFISINNLRGKFFFNKIKNKMFIKKIPMDEAKDKLKSISLPYSQHYNRNAFFSELLVSTSMSNLIKKHLNSQSEKKDISKNVAIFNMRLPSNNYGAILQSFALCKSINDMGYKAKVIDYFSDSTNNKIDNHSVFNFYKFRENYINRTHKCFNKTDLIKLNKQYSTFIVGSDQVWNYNYIHPSFPNDIGRYFLNFVLPSKNIFSYAPSFAENHWKGSEEEIKEVKKLLERFSSVSVREKSGQKICKELFNIEAEHVLDPTLLLERKDYIEIINSEFIPKKKKKFIAYFTLDEKLEKNICKYEKINIFAKNNNLDVFNIKGYKKHFLGEDKFIYNKIQLWLDYINNCEFLITDSYHAVLFAIIFHKQFLIIEREYAGNERFKSIFSLFNLETEGRIFPSLKEMTNLNQIYKNKINYKDLKKILNLERKKSLNYLKNGLEKNIEIKDRIENLENELLESTLKNTNLDTAIEEKDRLIESIENTKNNQIIAQSIEYENKIKLIFNTKTFRYVKKIKLILKKFGINKFKI